MYLEDKKCAVLTAVLCLLFANLGKIFSTFTVLLIAFNIYVILGFGGIKDKIKTTYKQVYDKGAEACQKFIPRYNEEVPLQ